jgi:two-component system, OmpR family, sensor kinase
MAARTISRARPWRAMTLQGRLTVTVVAILVAASAVIGVVTTVALRSFLISRLDQQLQTANGYFADSQNEPQSDPDAAADARVDDIDDIPGQALGTIRVRVPATGAATAAVVSSKGVVTDTLPAADLESLKTVPANGHAHTVSMSSGAEYRAVAQTMPDGDLLITATPLDPVNDTIARLIVLELGLFLVVVGSSAVIAVVVIRRNLKPLKQVAATAQQVSNLTLADGEVELPHRVDVTDPATEVGQLGESFNHMLQHVEDALQTRNASEDRLRRFIADASHELRTPLASIRAHAQLIERGTAVTPEDVAHSIGRVESEAQRMSVLVEDLLLLARLDSGQPLAREQVDLTALVLAMVGDARLSAPDHQWHLDVPERPVMVLGDDLRLHQAVGNLLKNAAVHTPRGTTVMTRIVREPSSVLLTVSDNGPGVPDDLLPRVHERFVTGDSSRSRRAGGSGLGLAIVSAVAEAHNGSLVVTSEPGHTSFTVQLMPGKSARASHAVTSPAPVS